MCFLVELFFLIDFLHELALGLIVLIFSKVCGPLEILKSKEIAKIMSGPP